MARIFSRKDTKKKISRKRLQCETLEDRRLLAVVTTQAELEAAIAVSDPAIVFGNDIMVSDNDGDPETQTSVVIDNSVNIDGAGYSAIGDGVSRVFNVTDGDQANDITVTMTNLTITGGMAGSGGGLANSEDTTLNDVDITGNSAYQPNSNYAAFGGGFINTGKLTIENGSTVSGNTVLQNAGYTIGFGGGGASIDGRGDYLTGNELIVTDSTLDGNTAEGSGGAVFHRLGSMSVTDSVISNNISDAGADGNVAGGGVAAYSQGPNYIYSPLDVTVLRTTISGNTAASDSTAGYSFPYGAGFYGRGYGDIDFTDSFVDNNHVTGYANAYFVLARGGGAFFSADDGAPLDVDIDNTSFTGNSGDVHGGGVATRGRTDSVADIDITNGTFSGNYSLYGGSSTFAWAPAQATPGSADLYINGSTLKDGTGSGAVRNWFGGNVLINKTTISGNSGGTAAVDSIGTNITGGDNPPTTTVQNSTISGNSSSGNGGGLQNYDGFLNSLQNTIYGNTGALGGGIYAATYSAYVGQPYEAITVVNNNTITNNSAAYGGGGWAQNYYHGVNGLSSIENTIISGNMDATAPDFYDLFSPYVSNNMNYSFIGDTTGSGLPLTNASNKYDVVGGAMLGPLTLANGGPTATQLPLAGSPLINMGDPAILAGMDQRMYTRVEDGRMDIGSTEFNGVPTLEKCDINMDGVCDIVDIDLVTMGQIDYDMSGGFNVGDVEAWLVDAGASPGNVALTGGCPFLNGDFNLDGFADGVDFIIWNGSKFDPTDPQPQPMFSRGDANGDGFTDGVDFIIWNGSKFEDVFLCGGPLSSPGGHETLADGDSVVQSLLHRGKDTSHTQHKVGEGRSVFGALQSTEPRTAETVIQFAPAAITEKAFAEKSEDVKLGAVSVKAAATTTLNNYAVKSMDLATSRASSAHEAVDKIFANFG